MIRHNPDLLQVSLFSKVIEHADSLRSGLSRLSLKALTEYVNTYDLTTSEIKEAH